MTIYVQRLSQVGSEWYVLCLEGPCIRLSKAQNTKNANNICDRARFVSDAPDPLLRSPNGLELYAAVKRLKPDRADSPSCTQMGHTYATLAAAGLRLVRGGQGDDWSHWLVFRVMAS